MKKIRLHTAHPDRHGKRREAGEEIAVGTGARDAIDPATAKDLIDRGGAVEVKAARPKKDVAKQAASKSGKPKAPKPKEPAEPAKAGAGE